MSHSDQVVRVELAERGYDICLGSGNLAQLGERLTALRPVSHAVIVTDEHVEDPFALDVAETLSQRGIAVDVLVVEPGEETKSLDSVCELWQKLLELKADRKTVVVAVGGGVIGDLAGFAAAGFARGLGFVQVPTTLLAQVDSSVGGKTGVNLPGAKNIVGAFWQPMLVLIDTEVLASLPEREYLAGLAEVVKYGVILDADFFAYLEANVRGILARDPAVLRHIIARSCELKADVVRQDEREETGLRAVLNYGHTFCHAFEAVTGYGQYLHGEAVSIGMVCASRLAERLGRIPADMTSRQMKLLTALGLPIEVPEVDVDELLASMSHDKKVEHGRLRFVLPTRMGHVELVGNVSRDDVRLVLETG
ncbi:MAG: 3-dehydroquinate synthase [Pirellulales bacterium]|nr:3-dehydroquinate synthase [Pirellulales bacterium]